MNVPSDASESQHKGGAAPVEDLVIVFNTADPPPSSSGLQPMMLYPHESHDVAGGCLASDFDNTQ